MRAFLPRRLGAGGSQERGQGLLDRGRRKLALEVLHEGSDMEGLHVGELADAVSVAPLREAPCGGC